MKLFWQYGQLGTVLARRHKVTGRIEILLHKAGTNGHTQDYWHVAGAGHEADFTVKQDEVADEIQFRLLQKHGKHL